MTYLLLESLPHIRVVLFVLSSLMLAGALIGQYLQAQDVAQGTDVLSTGGQGRDKRRFPRFSSDAPLDLADHSGSFEKGIAQLINLSTYGACFLSPRQLIAGQRFAGRLHSTQETVLRITARIVWLKPIKDHMLYGVQFETMVPEAR